MHALGERAGVRASHACVNIHGGHAAAGFFRCTLPTVLRQLFVFVFELMFGDRMRAYRLLVLRLCARARPFDRSLMHACLTVFNKYLHAL